MIFPLKNGILLRMKIFAHRGVAHREADENSVEAFQRAIELGIDGIEVDVRLTKDGEPVVFHDKDLRRLAGDNRRIEDLTYRDLRNIVLRRGSSIPFLDDVTGCIPAPVQIDFEIKDKAALECIVRKLRTSKGLRERSFISSFNKTVLMLAKEELPDVPLYLLRRRWPIRLHRFEEWAKEVGLSGLGLVYTSWNEPRISWMEEREMRAITWEPMEPVVLRSTVKRAKKLEALGMELVIANQPEVYLEVVAKG